jgi:tRNA U54 and U55 pseudouridine synthase Pus10
MLGKGRPFALEIVDPKNSLRFRMTYLDIIIIYQH